MARCGCGCTCIVQAGASNVHVTGDGSSAHPFTITVDSEGGPSADLSEIEAAIADLTARVEALEAAGGGGVDGGSP